MGFSPFEILFGQRPHFPLSSLVLPSDIVTIPKDMKAYVESQQRKLNIIRHEMKSISTNTKAKMVERANKQILLTKGEYVYLLAEDKSYKIDIPDRMLLTIYQQTTW